MTAPREEQRAPRIRLFRPPSLWYENERGDQWVPPADDPGAAVPQGFVYQHIRAPHAITETIVRVTNDGETIPLGGGTATWDAQLVMAMVTAPWERPCDAQIRTAEVDELLRAPFGLHTAIAIAAAACSRCLSALAYEYGVANPVTRERRGYPVQSPEWAASNTRCEFCATREELNAIAMATGPGETFFQETPRAHPELFGRDVIPNGDLCLDVFQYAEEDEREDIPCELREGHQSPHQGHLPSGQSVWWNTGDSLYRYSPPT